MLEKILTRRNLLWLAFALICGAIGYAAAIVQAKRTEARHAVAELWYFHGVLSNMERGESQLTRAAVAYKADQALQTIAEAGDYLLLGNEYQEFRASVLKEYRAFRETHSDLYEFPSGMPLDSKDEWEQRSRALSEFVKKY